MTSLLVATRNAHKLGEIRAILGRRFACESLAAFPDAPALREDGDTFAANAEMKARQLADWLAGRASPDPAAPRLDWILADDSGLEVDALGGAPGVRSARFAADDGAADRNAPDVANNVKLLRLLEGVPAELRTARFRCVLALLAVARPSPLAPPHFFEGTCEGKIGFEPKGRRGFGYDPLFIPDGMNQSFAELGAELKNGLSHRFKALSKLRNHLHNY